MSDDTLRIQNESLAILESMRARGTDVVLVKRDSLGEITLLAGAPPAETFVLLYTGLELAADIQSLPEAARVAVLCEVAKALGVPGWVKEMRLDG